MCKLSDNINTFKITEIDEKIPDMELKISLSSMLKYDPIILSSKNFTLDNISDNNSQTVHKEIWELFKNFAEECHSKLSRKHRRQKIEYLTSSGFPICLLSNGDEIVTIGRVTPDGILSLHFLWLGQEV